MRQRVSDNAGWVLFLVFCFFGVYSFFTNPAHGDLPQNFHCYTRATYHHTVYGGVCPIGEVMAGYRGGYYPRAECVKLEVDCQK